MNSPNKMDKENVSDIIEGQEIFISYKDDNENTISGFAVLLELSEKLVKFKTNQNIIIIPTSRLLKIKQRLDK